MFTQQGLQFSEKANSNTELDENRKKKKTRMCRPESGYPVHYKWCGVWGAVCDSNAWEGVCLQEVGILEPAGNEKNKREEIKYQEGHFYMIYFFSVLRHLTLSTFMSLIL